MESAVYELYRRGKVWLNYCLDRVIGLCDMILMDAYQLPWSAGQSMAKHIARYVGDVSWLLRALPRLPAYKLVGANWTIVVVGTEQSLGEVRHLFEQEADRRELGRVALWTLSTQIQHWFAEGVDLIVCELGHIHPWPLRAALTFTVPIWIQQILTIPDPPDRLLVGRRIKGIRCKIKQAQKAGFTYRFSQAKSDFDYFYYHIYLPFIKKRHGDLAMVTPYQDQWQRWFTRGGLVLVTQHDQLAAGTLCYTANHTCYYIEGGIVEADPDLFRRGINAVNIWYAITWAHDQGVKLFDMGGTHAWRSNGSFVSKHRWGAHVVRRKRIYGMWTFLAQDLSPSLQEYIDKLGFISEVGGKFCGVLLHTDPVPIAQTAINEQLSVAKNQGLDGLLVISPGSKQAMYDVEA